MGGVTSTSFGLLIAYLLPGLIGLYGASLWSNAVSKVFSTFLTSSSNVGLFILILLGSLVVGLVVSGLRWLLVEVLLFQSLFGKARTLFRVRLRTRVLFQGH